MEEKRQRIEERKKSMASTTTKATQSVDKPKDIKETKVTSNKKDGFVSPATTNQVKGPETKDELKGPQLKIEVHATATHHEAEQHLEPKVAHSMSHDFSHDQRVSRLKIIETFLIRNRNCFF